MTDCGLGTPIAFATSLGMSQGEFSKQKTVYTVPAGRMFIIEYIGIHSSLPPDQELSPAILPSFNDGNQTGLTVYPIALPGKGASHNPNMPLRRFGSQQLLLYANHSVDISAIRSSVEGEASVEFNISGRLVSSAGIQPPENLTIS